MTDLEKVLKNSLHNFKNTKETCKKFCNNTIVLTATTFERVSKNYSESNGNMMDKIYRVIVTIDGQTRFEHYGSVSKDKNALFRYSKLRASRFCAF